jgi:plastocyanin
MSRRLLPAAIVVCLMGAACGNPIVPSVSFGSGKQFVPQVADFLDDVGLYPSIAVDAQGTPYATYFGFLPKLKEGEILPARPVLAPSLPAVLMASTKDGIWSRGAVAIRASIPNVNVSFGPATVPQVKTITADTVNGTAIAVDPAGGFHVAWAADTGLWYAESAGTSFTASLLKPIKPPLKVAGPLGPPSVAAASDGTPWVAYTAASGRHQDVTVKTRRGGGWRTSIVDALPSRAAGGKPLRTAVGVMSGDRPIVVYSDGSKVLAARAGPGATAPTWVSSPVEKGADGVGLSLAVAKDGVHVAYYAGNAVHTATSSDGTSWKTSTVASVGNGTNESGRSTGIAVDDTGTTYVAWYDPGTDSVRLASASSKAPGTFTPIQTRDTLGGDMPALAATADGSAVYLAWHRETSEDLMLGTYATVSGLALAVQSPTPTGGATVTGPCPPPATKLDISAQGTAFDKTCLAAPSKKTLMVTFDNKDTITHNFAIYTQNPLTNPAAKLLGGATPTELVAPGQSATYDVSGLAKGTYFFRCDVHPTQMTGAFQVK